MVLGCGGIGGTYSLVVGVYIIGRSLGGDEDWNAIGRDSLANENGT
jgi:hypothetical protein